MNIILHIAQRDAWDKAKASRSYQGDTLELEGYIHCSTSAQLIPVANRLFRGRTDLVLLCIDRSQVKAEIRDENLEGGSKLFPHIYGPLNTDAVIDVFDFPPQADGCFVLPEALNGL